MAGRKTDGIVGKAENTLIWDDTQRILVKKMLVLLKRH